MWSHLPHFPWKFKSWAGKWLKIRGSNPRSRRSKNVCHFFFLFSYSPWKTAYLCFIWFLDIKKWLNSKIPSFVWRIWKEKEKRTKIFWPSGAGIWTPDFQSFSRPWFEFSWKVRRMRSNQNKLLKKLGLYIRHCNNNFDLLPIGNNITAVIVQLVWGFVIDWNLEGQQFHRNSVWRCTWEPPV